MVTIMGIMEAMACMEEMTNKIKKQEEEALALGELLVKVS